MIGCSYYLFIHIVIQFSKLIMNYRRNICLHGVKFLGAVAALFIWCEYVVYYAVLYQCSWPSAPEDYQADENGLRSILIADTHLLGPYRGHWFDKLRREWQMHRAFQTAMWMFKPEVIFFLGDLFDEGMWVSDPAFNSYVTRFQSLFSVPPDMKIIVVPGNHDMGFHYELAPRLYARFNQAFNTSSMQMITAKNVTFVLINSMAMHDDGCYLCHSAQIRLKNIARKFDCARNRRSSECKGLHIPEGSYGPPIIMQHFPMYRESDMVCTEPDSAPPGEKEKPFRIKWDCLSKQSTDTLLTSLQPRLIMSGHTHHACLVHHRSGAEDVPEYSVPSFSWRNRDDPSFFFGIFTSNGYSLSKCFLPRERSVVKTYILGAVLILGYVIISIHNWRRKSRSQKTE